MADYHRKLVTLDRLMRIVAELRGGLKPGAAARKIVQCHGCFDIVHPGHIRYLEFARSQGDVLIVSITGDAGIDKGDLRPYIPQELRAENLAALEFVDYVVVDENPTARELLTTIQPDIYVKGQEYATSGDPRLLAERQVVESYGGRIIFSSGQVVFSSSRLVEMVSPHDDLATQRLTAVCQRHGIDRRGLTRLLHEFRGRRVIVLGDTVVDRYVLCDAAGVAGEAPMVGLRELDQKEYLGGAALVAAQLAALGAEAILVTGIGPDATSGWAVQQLQARGVCVHPVRHRRELVVRTRFLVDEHKLFKTDRAEVYPLDSIGERDTGNLLISLATDADAAIVHDGGYGMITPGLAQLLGSTFRHRVKMVTGGAWGPQANLIGLRYFDMICCSERRLRMALNDLNAGLSTLVYKLLEKTQAGRMLVTLGKRGVLAFDRRSPDRQSPAWTDRLNSEYLPAFAARAVDRLGCGEAILAGAALAASCGGGLMQQAYIANVLAAVQIEALGVTPVPMDEVRQWLSRRPELAEGMAERNRTRSVGVPATC